MTDVAWVTCRELPEFDPDEAPALRALEAAGLGAARLAWDDPRADPADFDLCVLRSCWNYYEDPRAFVSWVEEADRRTLLKNAPAVVRWNVHKRYLRRLEERDVPVVPTLHLARGEAASYAALVEREGWSRVVIKPAVSASSYETRSFLRGDELAGQAFLEASLAARDTLVQEFVAGFEGEGEKALVWIDGAFTHAVVKQPRFADDEEAVSAAVPVEAAEAELGERALAAACEDGGFAREDLMYARVDTVPYGERRVISELELLEPSLYFAQCPAALDRWVDAVKRLLGR